MAHVDRRIAHHRFPRVPMNGMHIHSAGIGGARVAARRGFRHMLKSFAPTVASCMYPRTLKCIPAKRNHLGHAPFHDETRKKKATGIERKPGLSSRFRPISTLPAEFRENTELPANNTLTLGNLTIDPIKFIPFSFYPLCNKLCN